MSRSGFACALVLLGFLACAPRLHAQSVTWPFGGVVDGVSDLDGILSGVFSPGDRISGAVTFGLGTPDANGDPHAGDYFSAISTIMGELGPVSFSGPTSGFINTITIRDFMDRNDTVAFSAGVSLFDIPTLLRFGYDVSPDTITTDQLPEFPPVTTGDLGGDFLFESNVDGMSFKVFGTINFVPEPSTLLLLALSSCALLRRRREHR